jgi:hypothetical protein
MSKRLYPHKNVRYWYAYDIEEICAHFSDFRLNHQTVRAWIKRGLKTIDSNKSILIYGNDLITFLREHNAKGKCKTAFEKFFCMKCRDACPAYKKRAIIISKNRVVKVHAKCRVCKTDIYKHYKLTDMPALRKTFIRIDVLELDDCLSSASKTHFKVHSESNKNESLQGSLF